MAEDHLIGSYTLLLDLFQAACIVGKDRMPILKKAWALYVQEGQPAPMKRDFVVKNGRVMVERRSAPARHHMMAELSKALDGEGDAQETAGLLEMEMLRLCEWYGLRERDGIDWRIFVIAVYQMFLCPSVQIKMWRKYCARLRQTFAGYDRDADGYLGAAEFTDMCKAEFFHDMERNREEKQALIDAEFLKIDIDKTRPLSFQEYALWRWMVEFARADGFGDWRHDKKPPSACVLADVEEDHVTMLSESDYP